MSGVGDVCMIWVGELGHGIAMALGGISLIFGHDYWVEGWMGQDGVDKRMQCASCGE